MSTNLPLSSRITMQEDDTGLDDLVKSLADNFNILADEVQLLSDRKTILEHKLRFAHEQYQHLADKYAPSDPEISDILTKLQLPPELKLHSQERATFVPLPSRRPSGSKQQTAEAIRDGRKASKRLASLRHRGNPSEVENRSISGTTDSILKTSQLGTSATSFEQDFTIPGKKSELLCPFAKMANKSKLSDVAKASWLTSDPISGPQISRDPQLMHVKSPIHPPSADPICAALYIESHPSPPPSVTGSAAKCPIRFLDQHSPEEVARYFETHKHEIPRSHEVCVKRYQRNEEDIRKLDAKYGNLVSMISGLGQKHQPMLQVKEDEPSGIDERKSNERVQNWAKSVGINDTIENDTTALFCEEDRDREGRFDRPMKEIRVGESPSRPWGISVPYVDQPNISKELGKPHEPTVLPSNRATSHQSLDATKCPFDHCQKIKNETGYRAEAKPFEGIQPQPAFIVPPEVNKMADFSGPQMVFTGPVFIGYPVEQAMTLMQQWQLGASVKP